MFGYEFSSVHTVYSFNITLHRPNNVEEWPPINRKPKSGEKNRKYQQNCQSLIIISTTTNVGTIK